MQHLNQIVDQNIPYIYIYIQDELTNAITFVLLNIFKLILDSDRSEECIDFTMMCVFFFFFCVDTIWGSKNASIALCSNFSKRK
jgi:hypothetical protein